jgi:Right handed beta helix region
MKVFSLSRQARLICIGSAIGLMSPLVMSVGAASASARSSLTSGTTIASSCTGISVASTDDLAAKISSAPSGSTFCIHAGTFSLGTAALTPKDNDKLIGDPVTRAANGSISAPTKIVGTGPAIVDVGLSIGVLIKNLDISGARGTYICRPLCGRGISHGVSLTVSYSRIHGNALSGIGGIDTGSVVDHTELDHNGSSTFLGCCAAGVKGTTDYTVQNSYVHDNTGNGVWQDGCGSNFKVTNSRITNSTLSGVRYEHNQDCSGSASITGNTIKNNNLSGSNGSGGVAINSAPGATVSFNIFGGNQVAGASAGGTRGALTGTSIHDNTMNGDLLKGCFQPGVSCLNNH